MDYRLRPIVEAEVRGAGLTVADSFYTKIDSYIAQHFSQRSSRDKVVIEAYLARAALRIALTEHKRTLEAEDAKAAIWLFHLPDQPDDTCSSAGQQALAKEAGRPRYTRGLLTEGI